MRRASLPVALLALVALTTSNGCAIRLVGPSLAGLFRAPKPVLRDPDPRRPGAKLAVTWGGHATALVQIGRHYVLTDPVLTSSVGQVSVRLVEPGLDAKTLPPLDAVAISHLHFDHFSLGTLESIAPKVKQLYLPPGGFTYLTDFGFAAEEVPPNASFERDGLVVTAVPVNHVGFRYAYDGVWMTESFTGWVFRAEGVTVFFAGDTAYDPQYFKGIRERFPTIDLALIPIAPIGPRSFMRRTHVDPEEALSILEDTGAKTMVPIHYDTFVNSTDQPGEALRELHRAARARGLEERLTVLPPGEVRVLMK